MLERVIHRVALVAGLALLAWLVAALGQWWSLSDTRLPFYHRHAVISYRDPRGRKYDRNIDTVLFDRRMWELVHTCMQPQEAR